VKRVGVALVLGLLTTACSTPATSTALSSSFAEVFAGLYVAQQAHLGRTDVTAGTLHPRSLCRRTGPASQGPGEDWVCAVQYVDADSTVTQSFDMQVKPDGCWRADGAAASQPAVLADPVSGQTSVNQLAEFDGCLNTSWS
jgi:hypothetical protein